MDWIFLHAIQQRYEEQTHRLPDCGWTDRLGDSGLCGTDFSAQDPNAAGGNPLPRSTRCRRWIQSNGRSRPHRVLSGSLPCGSCQRDPDSFERRCRSTTRIAKRDFAVGNTHCTSGSPSTCPGSGSTPTRIRSHWADDRTISASN